MNKKTQSIIICCILLVSPSTVFGISHLERQSLKSIDDLDDVILNKMEQKHLPGLSASLVIDDVVRWQNSYGNANIEGNISVSNDTLFKIASVSKTVTASALMQLYEQGFFSLTDPINDYLPYDVIHPLYPSVNITFHMLLTHSSSINDNWDYLFHFVGDAPIPFQTFLEEYLVPGGLYYDAEDNFCSFEPGTSWRYSNIAVALVGYLVEVISQMNFTHYIQSSLFDLLDMNESAWFLRNLNVSHIAMPYSWDAGEYVPYGHIGWVDVPAGDLRTSSSQLIHFLTMFINNGRYNDQVILQNSTVNLMLTPQLLFQPNLGLIWWKSTIGGRTVWGHNGGDYGARAMMHFDPSTHIGVVVLTNGESDLTDICDILFDYAEQLNSPPDTPDQPTGPHQGKIYVEYTYASRTIDSDDDLIYYQWDWGDGHYSEWVGPYHSGENCSASHIWTKPGRYSIVVKAKDSDTQESAWSDPLEITIQNPFVDLTIDGGLGIVLEIKNNGTETATNLSWKINLEGGCIIGGRNHTGTVDALGPGSSEKIRIFLVGVGKTTIGAEIRYTDSVIVEKTARFFVFFVFLLEMK